MQLKMISYIARNQSTVVPLSWLLSGTGTELWLKPRSWSCLCRASWTNTAWNTSAATLIHPSPSHHMQTLLICDPWNIKMESCRETEPRRPLCWGARALGRFCFVFFLLFVSILYCSRCFWWIWQWLQPRKSEFIAFGFDTPHTGERVKHSFWFLKSGVGIRGLFDFACVWI